MTRLKYIVAITALTGCAFFLGNLAQEDQAVEQERLKVDRADFMLECVYGWDLSNAQCEAILDGGTVPPLPDSLPGC